MSVLYLVLPLALVIVGAAVLAFVWSARSGQYDDLETPAVRVLHDDIQAVKPPAPPVDGRPAQPRD
jgi:cbb3-type cytochrome oxidase maturation protein